MNILSFNSFIDAINKINNLKPLLNDNKLSKDEIQALINYMYILTGSGTTTVTESMYNYISEETGIEIIEEGNDESLMESFKFYLDDNNELEIENLDESILAAIKNPIKYTKIKNNAKKLISIKVKIATLDIELKKKLKNAKERGVEVDKEKLEDSKNLKRKSLEDKLDATGDRMDALATTDSLKQVVALAKTKSRIEANKQLIKFASEKEAEALKIQIKNDEQKFDELKSKVETKDTKTDTETKDTKTNTETKDTKTKTVEKEPKTKKEREIKAAAEENDELGLEIKKIEKEIEPIESKRYEIYKEQQGFDADKDKDKIKEFNSKIDTLNGEIEGKRSEINKLKNRIKQNDEIIKSK